MNVQLMELWIKYLTLEEVDSFSKLIIVFKKRKTKDVMAETNAKKIQRVLTWSQI